MKNSTTFHRKIYQLSIISFLDNQTTFNIPNSKFKQTTRPWPKALSERVRAIEEALSTAPATPADLAAQFSRAKPAAIAEILETLVTMGRARQQGQKFSR